METARQLADRIVRSSDYVRRWFSAENFFNTKYTSPAYEGNYFITHDEWMSSDVWALRHVTGDGIDTVFQGDSQEDCINAMKEQHNANV